MDKDLELRQVMPEGILVGFVDSLWMLHNRSGEEKHVIGLPDGRIDVIFARSRTEAFRVMLLGLNTQPDKAVIPPHAVMFAVSFKLLAAEYILRLPLAGFANQAMVLPEEFWDMGSGILDDFDVFCSKALQKIHTLLPDKTDERKRNLLALIYASRGAISVGELSAKVFWSARQINRYFNQQFGVSLKAYCNILRFRASLDHIAKGALFPELDFADQSHFIKEIKKFSGVIPKDCSEIRTTDLYYYRPSGSCNFASSNKQ